MLRKIAILATGTVGGVVAVVAYHPPQLHSVNAVGVATAPTASTSTTGTTGVAPAAKAPATAGKSGTFTGNTANTAWGPVQVQITVTAGKIAKVSALQYPNGDQRSKSIAQQSIPYLVQQTLGTKTANIVGVSGASYTSDGWRRSLASAMAKAGI
jgi:uncharacterized protein with FMN-binding domain